MANVEAGKGERFGEPSFEERPRPPLETEHEPSFAEYFEDRLRRMNDMSTRAVEYASSSMARARGYELGTPLSSRLDVSIGSYLDGIDSLRSRVGSMLDPFKPMTARAESSIRSGRAPAEIPVQRAEPSGETRGSADFGRMESSATPQSQEDIDAINEKYGDQFKQIEADVRRKRDLLGAEYLKHVEVIDDEVLNLELGQVKNRREFVKARDEELGLALRDPTLPKEEYDRISNERSGLFRESQILDSKLGVLQSEYFNRGGSVMGVRVRQEQSR